MLALKVISLNIGIIPLPMLRGEALRTLHPLNLYR
jgi:hypothetical protein